MVKNTHQQQQQVDYLEITPMPTRKLPQDEITKKELNPAPFDYIRNLTSQGNKQAGKDQLKELNFFLHNNVSQKTSALKLRLPLKIQIKPRKETDIQQKRHSNARIKARSFLTNIAYVGFRTAYGKARTRKNSVF